jgi:DNA-directed RNA polymerase
LTYRIQNSTLLRLLTVAFFGTPSTWLCCFFLPWLFAKIKMHNSLSQFLSRQATTRYWTNNNQHALVRRFSRRRHLRPFSSSFQTAQQQPAASWASRTASTIAATGNQHGRDPYAYPHRALSTAAAPRQDEDDDEEELSLDDEIEALAASCFPVDNHDDNNIPKDSHRLREQRLRMDYSSLDLELGEISVWDSPDNTVPEDESDLDDHDEYDEAAPDDPLDFPIFPEGTPAAELHRQKLQREAASPRRHQPVLSPLDMLERLSLGSSSSQQQQDQQQQQQRYPDTLSYVGPVQIDEMIRTSNNKDDALRQIQLQLECEAQHEAVQKYRRLTEQTRSRKDYAALSSLQKLILHWYQPIRDEIETAQRDYIFYEAVQKGTNKKAKKGDEDDGEKERQFNNTAIHCYGPLLNTVEPEKLAVILTHEALTMSISKSQEKSNYRGGSSVVDMAQKLGKAVEEEVLLQRVLKRKMEEEQAVAAEAEKAQTNATVATFASQVLHESVEKQDDTAGVGAVDKPWSYAESRLTSYLKEMAGDGAENVNNAKNRRNIAYAVRRARRSLNAEDWSLTDKVQVGTILLKILLDHATIRLPDGSVQPAFRMEKRWHAKPHGGAKGRQFRSTNFILVHDALWKLAIADEFESIAATTTRHKPMVVPPEPWTSPHRGGYAWLKTDLIRFHGSQMQREALDSADLTTVLDGLNALSREAWVINKTILNVANECWEKNIPLGDIPSRTNLEVPPEPTPPAKTNFLSSEDPYYDEAHVEAQKKEWAKEFSSYKEARNRRRRVLQKNRDMFSLRCSASLKLGQAKQFQDYDSIYFPYNMDFRGRAYPVPPHLSNVGSDLCRGMLKFAKKKPLGKRGLFWLQVHLANLAGKDKMTFEARAQYSIDNLDNVRKSVEDPLGRNLGGQDGDERPWWMGLDDPFQGLATCYEIINAIDSGNPETYMCDLPVHMDGSCNGLQHYAALGRDLVGGTAVNLCNYDAPQDVYIGVMEEVIRRVAEEANREFDYDENSLSSDEKVSSKQKKELARNRSAKMLNGLIDRGVVKRTVMTSVYGVTYIGARTQIQEKIEEKVGVKLGVFLLCFVLWATILTNDCHFLARSAGRSRT